MSVRKFISSFFVVVFLLLIAVEFPISASAAKYDLFEYEMYDENSVVITKYTGGAAEKVVIPEEIDGYPVKVIGEDAFSDAEIYEVELPETLEIIEDFAFWNTALYTVVIPQNVSHIGVGAFSGGRFTEYKVEDNNKTYQAYRGSLYTSLSELIAFPTMAEFYIHPHTSTIAPYAFISALNLKDIEIDTNVEFISEGAFIESVEIEGRGRVDHYAFYGCENLTSVDVGDSQMSVSINAFEETPWFNNQPDGVICFREGRMAYMYKGVAPEKIELKPGVYSINEGAFAGQKNLKEIVIPQTVGIIELSAFDGCTSLENIVVHEDDSTYKSIDGMLYSNDETRFYLCPEGKTGSVSLSIKTKFIEDYAFKSCEKLTDIKLFYGITVIGEGAFVGCSGIKELKLPTSVENAGAATFFDCSSLEDIVIPEGSTAFTDVDFFGTRWLDLQPEGVLYLCNNALGYKGDPTEITELTFKEGTIAVAEDAFFGFELLNKVTFPDTLKKIGDYAFATCPSLKEVSIPAGIKSVGVQSFGFIRTYNEETGHWSSSKMSDFTVRGYENTDAMNFANFYDYEFISLGDIGDFEYEGLLGDTNGDGVISIKDATTIQKHVVGFINLNKYQYENADFNGDGNVNVKDATAIQKFLVGLPY